MFLVLPPQTAVYSDVEVFFYCLEVSSTSTKGKLRHVKVSLPTVPPVAPTASGEQQDAPGAPFLYDKPPVHR